MSEISREEMGKMTNNYERDMERLDYKNKLLVEENKALTEAVKGLSVALDMVRKRIEV